MQSPEADIGSLYTDPAYGPVNLITFLLPVIQLQGSLAISEPLTVKVSSLKHEDRHWLAS